MPARTYRPRRVPLPDGETLALRATGSIDRIDSAGAVVETWAPTDPEWGRRAIRFGLRVTPETIAPSGRDVPPTKPRG